MIAVSAMTGKGVDEFFDAVDEKAKEFERDYQPELEKRRREREQGKKDARAQELDKLMRDMNVNAQARGSGDGLQHAQAAKKRDIATISDEEDEDMASDEEGGELVEPDEDEETNSEQHEGLTSRYHEALADEGGGNLNSNQSFERYLRASNGGDS